MVNKSRLIFGLATVTNNAIKRKFPKESEKVDIDYLMNIEDTSFDFNLGMSFAYFQLYEIFENLRKNCFNIEDVAGAISENEITLEEGVDEIQEILECDRYVATIIATQFNN
ncbi:MAG: hypothetical protein KBT03_00535 [Bacteroidales bacterium]|nr:hypothetical protein [Candidatus Scybalousia scybalohippi]